MKSLNTEEIEEIEQEYKKRGAETEYEAILRVPTAEPYAYLEIKVYNDAEAIYAAYQRFTKLIKGEEGISDSEFDQFIENQISGKGNLLGTYNRMSNEQRKYVQINKRAVSRIHYKVNKQNGIQN